MKAVRIHEYGDAGVLRYEEAPMPNLAPDEILIRAAAASVNPVDWKVREGYLKEMIPHKLPLVLGWDVSGVVEAVGAKAARFKVGDAVYSRPDLKREGMLARDSRIKERKKAGLRGARKRPQFSKR